MRIGSCKHYNGTVNESCKAGVQYANVTPDYGKPGWAMRLPCRPAFSKKYGHECGCCPKFEEPTAAEIKAYREEIDRHVAMMEKVMPVVAGIKKQHRGKDWQGVVECPVCGGQLALSHSSYNGHVWGRCDTKDCVAWME